MNDPSDTDGDPLRCGRPGRLTARAVRQTVGRRGTRQNSERRTRGAAALHRVRDHRSRGWRSDLGAVRLRRLFRLGLSDVRPSVPAPPPPNPRHGHGRLLSRRPLATTDVGMVEVALRIRRRLHTGRPARKSTPRVTSTSEMCPTADGPGSLFGHAREVDLPHFIRTTPNHFQYFATDSQLFTTGFSKFATQ